MHRLVLNPGAVALVRWWPVEQMNLCDKPSDVLAETSSTCNACLSAVRDIADVLLRAKGTKYYLTNAHISNELDQICAVSVTHGAGGQPPPDPSPKPCSLPDQRNFL